MLCIPVRPNLDVVFWGFKNQINKGFTQSTCWKRWRIIINGPEPISSKSVWVKRTKIWKLQRESQYTCTSNLGSDQSNIWEGGIHKLQWHLEHLIIFLFLSVSLIVDSVSSKSTRLKQRILRFGITFNYATEVHSPKPKLI